MRTVAIPAFVDRVSSRLDCSESVLLIGIEGGKVVRRLETRWAHLNPLERVQLLIREGVDVLICGGLTETCALLLREAGMEVIPWVRGDVEVVLDRYLRRRLDPDTSQHNDGARR
jgi:predicted Fe-Mo cluster-binding NifX family protein